MRRFGLFLYFWVPPLAWMSLIFLLSGDSGSVQKSSRLLGPFFTWLLPNATPETIGQLVFYCRKLAHVTEYYFCAILLWRALRRHTAKDRRPWTWREPALALLIVFLYAITDEVHQTFVPGRQGAAFDVALDTLGGALGLASIWLAGKWSRRW